MRVTYFIQAEWILNSPSMLPRMARAKTMRSFMPPNEGPSFLYDAHVVDDGIQIHADCFG